MWRVARAVSAEPGGEVQVLAVHVSFQPHTVALYLLTKQGVHAGGYVGQEEIRGTSTELVSPNAKMGRCVTRPQEV